MRSVCNKTVPTSDQLEIQPLVLFLLVQKEELRHLEENHESKVYCSLTRNPSHGVHEHRYGVSQPNLRVPSPPVP